MEDAKLPDLSRLRHSRSKPQQLPTQKSAEDTSNWDARTFSAPIIEVERELFFEVDPTQPIPANPYLEQERVKSAIRAEKKK